MIAALFVDANGVYRGCPDVDPWDVRRDARNFHGFEPVIAHPPCSVWCQLAPLNQARYGRMIGEDGGCFRHALESVRRFGGVLEHPAKSLAWEAFGLLRPAAGGWQRAFDGSWVCEVNQGAYGHPARKATWLYACVRDPLPMRWADPLPTATVSYLTNHGGGSLPRLTKKQARATPIAFRDELIRIAKR
jgi:hypothetical protein